MHTINSRRTHACTPVIPLAVPFRRSMAATLSVEALSDRLLDQRAFPRDSVTPGTCKAPIDTVIQLERGIWTVGAEKVKEVGEHRARVVFGMALFMGV